jgi:TonB family protein
MNEQIFAAAAAASFLLATAVNAMPNATLQAFLDEAYSQAEAQLGGAELGQPVKARAYVDADGRLTAVRIVNSTGSREADYRVETALKKVRVHYVPPALIGAQVNLAFGPADARLAKAP